jgi:hypothetical protein
LLEIHQTFKEELIPTLLKPFQEIEREGIWPNSLNGPNKDTTKERITG